MRHISIINTALWSTLIAASLNIRNVSAQDLTRTQFNPEKIAGPTSSNAITQQAGDVFNGPGPITVGWLGAKKQIVVPNGKWVLVAAEDFQSTHAVPISMTALSFALVDGSNVKSLLLVRFNSKVGPARSTWTDAGICENPSDSAPFAWHETDRPITRCVSSAFVPWSGVSKMLFNSIWKTSLQKLSMAGGIVPHASSLLTDLYVTGAAANYLKITRIDFGLFDKSPMDSLQKSLSSQLSVAERRRWAEAYSRLAVEGYKKSLPQEELFAGSNPTMGLDLLPD